MYSVYSRDHHQSAVAAAAAAVVVAAVACVACPLFLLSDPHRRCLSRIVTGRSLSSQDLDLDLVSMI